MLGGRLAVNIELLIGEEEEEGDEFAGEEADGEDNRPL
jgi:hypothetical protein